ncbi:hypothetical protein LTS17_001590 [Exophiala oligosperma]
MAGTVDRVMSLDIQDASSAKEAAISEAAVHIEGSAGSFAANGPVGPDGKPLQFDNGRPVVSPEDEKLMKRLKLKLDMWILPILTVVMLLGSMDKSDIGNVQTAGMQKYIGATGHQWAQVVSLFYIGYVITQFVASVQLRKLSPPIVVGGGVMFWGAMTMLLSVVKTWQAAVGIRILIGCGEGYIHAASLYLSMWYGPEDLASRGAIYFSMSTLAGAFNGLIAYGIVKDIGNADPYYAWQWILIIEGSITVFFGVLCVFLLPTVPERVRWGFTAEEKRLLVIRTWRANNTPNAKFKWKEFIQTFQDPAFWGYVVMYIGCQIGLACLASFLPAVIHDLGYTAVRSQLMTVPIYACAFVGTIGIGYLADKTQKRGLFVLGAACLSLTGYIMLAAIPHNIAGRYVGLCFIAATQYANASLIQVWLAFNTRKWTNRATAGAFLAMFAQAGALGGLQGFDTKPPYRKGNIIVMVVVIVMIPACIFNMWWFTRQNKLKEARKNDPDSIANRNKTFEELGTEHPDFRFST